MGKRGRPKKTSAVDFLASPPPSTKTTSNGSDKSPKSFDFKLKTTIPASAFNSGGGAANSHRQYAPLRSPSPNRTTASSISELKEMTSSRLDSMKRQFDSSFTDMAKEFGSSHSRLHKRCKMQTQACQKMVDESDKEFKEMQGRISGMQEAMKASWDGFIAEAQANANRVCKTSIPELAQSFEKAIDALRSRHGISSA